MKISIEKLFAIFLFLYLSIIVVGLLYLSGLIE